MTTGRRAISLFAAAATATALWSLSLHAFDIGDSSQVLPEPNAAPGAPTVTLAAPAAGAFVTGLTVLRAEVTPADAAASAVFFVDGRETCRRSAAPFECEWDAGSTIAAHQVRLVVNLKAGGRVVRNARTAHVAFAESVDVDVVQVTATVTDDRGRYVTRLPRSAFRVYEDGVQQPVSHFYADDAPLELIVALDLSSSMTAALPTMKRAVSAFLQMVPARHRLTLLGFNDEVFTLLPPTPDPSERERVLNSLSAWGMTSLYETVVTGVEMLRSRPGRKAVLIFTDGQDQGSLVTVSDVESVLHAGDAILYVVCQGQGMVTQSLKQLMDRLALPTGGRTISTQSIDALQDAFSELFDEMAHQYVLGYQAAPGVPGDDRWREIKVEVEGGYRVRARQGYRKGHSPHP